MTTATVDRTETLRDLYVQHRLDELCHGGISPAGCFWCGGRHPSDCCPQQRGEITELSDAPGMLVVRQRSFL